VQLVDGSSSGGAAGELGGHGDAQVVVQAEDTVVEQFVVQGAQRQTVVRGVWAVEGEPADVRGFDTDGGGAELSVEAAESASPVGPSPFTLARSNASPETAGSSTGALVM
jgi:hypothetical protein